MTKKLQLEIPVLLPEVPDDCASCVHRLLDNLGAVDGVEGVHIVEATGGAPAKLCIHYDPGALTLLRVRQQAERLGAGLTNRFGHVVWAVEGLTNQRRARTISEHLLRHPGVIEARGAATGLIRVEFDREQVDERTLRGILLKQGARVVETKTGAEKDTTLEEHEHLDSDEHAHVRSGPFGEKTELVFATIAGALVCTGFALSFVGAVPAWLPVALFVGAYASGGFFAVREALGSIRVGRFEIDFLMLVAAAGAAALGEWLEGAFLLFLFSLGHALEHYAMGRARRAIEALAEVTPDTAVTRRGGEEREVSVGDLRIGDIVIVRPNERLPADGFVVKGTSAVNQAPVTGESIPVDKMPVADQEAASTDPNSLEPTHRVFAGTINGQGALEVEVTKRASESTLARVVQMVTEAETQQSPTQRFTDRFERIFVPAVLGFSVLLLFAWVIVEEPFSASFYRALAVLVAASPCALAIATPSAVLSAVARAGRGGVLVKGGGPLENLGALRAIAFDKTGTLTIGRPRVTDILPLDGVTRDDLLRITVAVERLSDHPLATAIVRYGEEHLDGLPAEKADDLESITGRGVKAALNGETVYIGKDDLFDEIDGPELPDTLRKNVNKLEAEGRTTMIVRRGTRYLGVLGLMDTPRESAAYVVGKLRGLGIRRMIMISGDNQLVAETIARQVGLDEAYGDLMPDDKVEAIKMLIKDEQVAMVGDGVNDAPAMAYATVGIAMGAAGSDVAMETADVALMADDLNHLPFVVELSRRAGRIIKQNLWLSLGMVAFLVPATIFGLEIGAAVALHEGSTVVVVFNALRLLAD